MRPDGGRRARPRPALALALVVTAVLTVAACSTSVIHGVDEKAANEAITALERAGIDAEKGADEGGGAGSGDGAAFSVKVGRGETARALALLRSLGLPRDRRHGFAEVYGQPSLIPSASEERARYLEALGGELERTLETADGVVSARVHLVLEENDPLALEPGPRTAARAAVLIKARAGRAPLPESDIQRLVAGSVPGLEPAGVAVVITRAPESNEGAPAELAALGPLRVTPASRPLLVAAIAVGLGVLALLAGLLLMTARRLALLQQPRGRAEELRQR
jgi:type III secretion protein J